MNAKCKILAVSITFILGGFSLAQGSVIDDILGQDFVLTINPEIVGANQDVYADVVSYSFDMNRASIKWFINGKKEKEGIGEKYFSFRTGDIGSITNFRVDIVAPNGQALSKSLILRPAEVDILWKASSSVPKEYKGKAILSSEMPVTMVAIPNLVKAGKRIPPNELYYDWELDDRKLPAVSGYNKQSFEMIGPQLFYRGRVSVTVSDRNKTLTATKSITLYADEPKVVFYEDHPLMGLLLNRAVGKKYTVSQDEMTMKAEPYFFSLTNARALKYSWMMNDKTIEGQSALDNIILRMRDGESGESKIKVFARNEENILQSASIGTLIQFGQ